MPLSSLFIQPEPPSPPWHGTGYQTLRDGIQRGDLEFRYFFAQHGVGSTSLLMWLRQHMDVVVNEPDCAFLARKENGSRHNAADMYDHLARIYTDQKDKGDGPVRMAVKFMPTIWPLHQNHIELFGLDSRPIWMVRHPALSLESRLQVQTALLLSDQEAGQQELSPENKALISSAVLNRDYRDYPYELWGSHANLRGRLDQFLNYVSAYAPTLNEIYGIDTVDNYEEGRRVALRRGELGEFFHMYQLRQDWMAQTQQPLDHILDFEAFQVNPSRYGTHIVQNLWGLAVRTGQPGLGTLVNAYDLYYHDRPGFSKIMFGHAFKHGAEIEPPLKSPVAPKKFPFYLREPLMHLAEAYYAHMCQSDIPYPKLDEVTDQMSISARFNAVTFGHWGAGEKAPLWPVLKIISRMNLSGNSPYGTHYFKIRDSLIALHKDPANPPPSTTRAKPAIIAVKTTSVHKLCNEHVPD